MFRRLPDPTERFAFEYEGSRFEACAGDSVAAALLANGIIVFRTSAVTGVSRGPWCLIGNCYECLVEIDGEPNRQACMVEVRSGMRVRRQRGAREELM